MNTKWSMGPVKRCQRPLLNRCFQKRPESAELICGIAGTRSAWKQTMQTESFFGLPIDTGKRSSREVEEFKVHPNAIKSLGVGECVVVRKYPQASACRIKIAFNR